VSVLAMATDATHEGVIIEAVRNGAQRLSVMLGWQQQPLAAPRADTHSIFID